MELQIEFKTETLLHEGREFIRQSYKGLSTAFGTTWKECNPETERYYKVDPAFAAVLEEEYQNMKGGKGEQIPD